MDSWTPLYAWDNPPKKKKSSKDKESKEKKDSSTKGKKRKVAGEGAAAGVGPAPGTEIPLQQSGEKYKEATVEEIGEDEE